MNGELITLIIMAAFLPLCIFIYIMAGKQAKGESISCYNYNNYTIKLKRKDGPFVSGDLSAGECGIDLKNKTFNFSTDGEDIWTNEVFYSLINE